MKFVIRLVKSVGFLVIGSVLLVVLLFGHRDIPLETLKAKYAGEASQFLAVKGMQVHYRDEGNPKDTLPLVLIHGTGSSLHTFDAWTANLQSDHRVIRMDLPGYGLTGPFPVRNYALSNYTDFVFQFLNRLGITRCVLVGNSLGGQIAWEFAAAHPEHVQKLILIDAAGYPFESNSVPVAFKMARIPVIKELFTYITPKFVVQSSVENVYADSQKVTRELIDRYFELSLRPGNRRAFVDRFAAKTDPNAIQKIPSINRPTLILWGEQDMLIPVENAFRFHRELPNDTLVILKNSGHVPMEENPRESLLAVQAFLQSK
jgi:pimeloyl-ACP methyl ester carboxylesterase